MKIVRDYPPNYRDIEETFKLQGKEVFTYGDTIYNPHGGIIDRALMKHEQVHMKQQGEYPKLWWIRYLDDEEFRLKQELEAYKEQIKEARLYIKDRNQIVKYIAQLAKDVSSSTYGGIIGEQEAFNILNK